MKDVIRDELKDGFLKSYNEGFITGIGSVSETMKRLKEKLGKDESFKLSEVILLVDQIAGENAKLIIESDH